MRPFLFVSLTALLFSCEEIVQLDLNQTEPRIVIEAQVTNQPGLQFVKITRTDDFYGSGPTPRVTDAVVSVSDNLGNAYSFIHNPNNHADSSGIYVPQSPFTGQIGRTYFLTVDADGERFEASDNLVSVIAMDSMKYQVNELEADDPKEPGKFYELLMFAREPQDEKNYYLFKFYRNDSLIYYLDTDIYYNDDELLAENIDGVPSPVYYGVGDTGRVEIYSLSRVGYVYYNDLYILLNNDAGGMFGPVPATPRSNLSNGALGFFQVSAVTETETVIDP